ncbi:MAG: winged helix-turn-helix transcriptional regulator [Clostridia bacterium]|nr:winged helix-turn-helix transcriptional regulator [Clostridia bacterium]
MNNLKKQILSVLQEDARLPLDSVAAMVGVETAAVKKAVAEMEADGTIIKYATLVNGDRYDGRLTEMVSPEAVARRREIQQGIDIETRGHRVGEQPLPDQCRQNLTDMVVQNLPGKQARIATPADHRAVEIGNRDRSKPQDRPDAKVPLQAIKSRQRLRKLDIDDFDRMQHRKLLIIRAARVKTKSPGTLSGSASRPGAGATTIDPTTD